MRLEETSFLYGLIGLAVGLTMVRLHAKDSLQKRVAHFVTGTVLWPLFVPILLLDRTSSPVSLASSPHQGWTSRSPHEQLQDPKLRAASQELWLALTHLHGVAEEILAPERERILHVFSELSRLEKRWHEMKQVLQRPGFQLANVEQELEHLQQAGCSNSEPQRESLYRRKHNIITLQDLHQRTLEELVRAQQKMEEVSTQLTLLRFVEHSDLEAITQLKQLTSSVESVTESLALLSQTPPTYNPMTPPSTDGLPGNVQE